MHLAAVTAVAEAGQVEMGAREIGGLVVVGVVIVVLWLLFRRLSVKHPEPKDDGRGP